MNDDEQRASCPGARVEQSHRDVSGDDRPLTRANSYRPVGGVKALFAFEHVPRFRTRMHVRPRARARRHHDIPELNLKRSCARKWHGGARRVRRAAPHPAAMLARS